MDAMSRIPVLASLRPNVWYVPKRWGRGSERTYSEACPA